MAPKTQTTKLPSSRLRANLAAALLPLGLLFPAGGAIGEPPPATGDRFSLFLEALESGEATAIDQSSEQDFLQDLLRRLDVPVESQVLVFSKTSLQKSLIDPDHPRALYFSDDFYVGWVQGGLVEVIAHDPVRGPLFYVVEREPSRTKPRITASEDCLSCHEGSRTRNVPGVLVRSLYIDPSGQPIHAAGSFLTDHSSPLDERWGGWYVTGQHGSLRHMGNTLASWLRDKGRAEIDREPGANLNTLEGIIDMGPYLRKGSDIVALMVLEHQVGMLNRLTEAGYYFRRSFEVSSKLYPEITDATTLAELSGSPLSVASSYAEKIVKYMLFCDEAQLPEGGIDGDPDFQDAFQKNSRLSSDGHSLKDFQLNTRLFKNRCSYLLYSAAFQSLHPALKDAVYRRLWSVLEGEDSSGDFDHLGLTERKRIQEILRDTITDFPDLREG